MVTPRRIAVAAAAALAVGWIAAPAPAAADGGLVVVGGAGAPRYGSTVGQAVEAAVRDAKWTLPAKALSRTETERMLGCLDTKTPSSCVPDALQVAQLFVITVEPGQLDNGAPLVVLTAKGITLRPAAIAVRRRYCEQCEPERLASAAGELATQVLRDMVARSGTTLIEIATVPDGALIVLDGIRVGPTNRTLSTFAGTHRVELDKPGYEPVSREVVVEEGKTATVSVTLVKRPDARRTRTGERPTRWGPRILIGAGAAVTVLGGVSIYLGESRGADDKYHYTRATTLGIGAGIAGVAMIVGGIYWQRAGADGVVAGWSGRF